MKSLNSALFLLFLSVAVYSQQGTQTLLENQESADFTGSDISLVVIETNGGFSIPDEVKIKAHMKIIDAGPGEWNSPPDPGNVYDGNVGIEIRGA
jgi:hypothetical protein